MEPAGLVLKAAPEKLPDPRRQIEDGNVAHEMGECDMFAIVQLLTELLRGWVNCPLHEHVGDELAGGEEGGPMKLPQTGGCQRGTLL
jgi:hypothetical protein